MKNSKQCPKCRSTDIVRTPGSVGPYGAGNIILLGRSAPVTVSRYLCAGCGFIEEWLDSAEDIAKVKNKFGQAPG